MRYFSRMAVMLACFLFLTGLWCSESTGPEPARAAIVVYVYFGEEGVPDKTVELVEIGEQKSTDSTGHVSFSVPAGSYTVRVYGLNRGGPSRLTMDFPITVEVGESKTLPVFDCPPCA